MLPAVTGDGSRARFWSRDLENGYSIFGRKQVRQSSNPDNIFNGTLVERWRWCLRVSELTGNRNRNLTREQSALDFSHSQYDCTKFRLAIISVFQVRWLTLRKYHMLTCMTDIRLRCGQQCSTLIFAFTHSIKFMKGSHWRLGSSELINSDGTNRTVDFEFLAST